MTDKKTLLLLLFIVIISIHNFNYINIYSEYIPLTPDDNDVRFFSRNLLETGNLTWQSELNEQYNVSFFAPRNIQELEGGTYASKRSVMFVLLFSVARIINFEDYIIPLIAIVGVFATFLLVSGLFDNKTGLIAASFLSVSPLYVSFSNRSMDAIPTLVFLVLSYYFFYRYIQDSKFADLIISSIFIIISMSLRWTNAGIYIIAYIPLIIYNKDRIKLPDLKATIFFTIFFGFIVLYLNKIVYGGFFKIPEVMRASKFSQSNNFEVIPFSIDTFNIAISAHIISIFPLLFILGMFGAIVLFRDKNSTRKSFMLSWVMLSISTLLFYGGRNGVFGFGSSDVLTSMSRYFIPIHFIILVLASIFIYYYSKRTSKKTNLTSHSVIILILSSVIIISFILIFNPTDGSLTIDEYNADKFNDRLTIIKELPENSIIFSGFGDKYITPIRDVAVIIPEESKSEKAQKVIYKKASIKGEIIPLMNNLINDGRDIYIIKDADTAPVLEEIRRDNSDLILIQIRDPWLYKIERVDK